MTARAFTAGDRVRATAQPPGVIGMGVGAIGTVQSTTERRVYVKFDDGPTYFTYPARLERIGAPSRTVLVA